MAAADLNQWDSEPGGGVSDARVVLGAVMVATVAAAAAASHLIGPAAAAKAATAMMPLLIVAALRTPLSDCSMYGGNPQRRYRND